MTIEMGRKEKRRIRGIISIKETAQRERERDERERERERQIKKRMALWIVWDPISMLPFAFARLFAERLVGTGLSFSLLRGLLSLLLSDGLLDFVKRGRCTQKGERDG